MEFLSRKKCNKKRCWKKLKVQQSRENNTQSSEAGNKTFRSGMANTGGMLGHHHNHQDQPSSGNFSNFSQQQQPNNNPAHGLFGPFNTNFGYQQEMPQTFSGLPDMSNQNMMNLNNSWGGINQLSKTTVMAMGMNRLQKQEKLRNELTSTGNKQWSTAWNCANGTFSLEKAE